MPEDMMTKKPKYAYEEQTAKQRYEALKPARQPYLDRGRLNSVLTIPSVLPPEGSNGQLEVYDKFQSLGPMATKNLASKMVLTFLPPNQPFFQLKPSEDLIQDAHQYSKLSEAAGQPVDAAQAIKMDVLKMDRLINDEVNASKVRDKVYPDIMNRIIAGNSLMYFPERLNATPLVYRLDQYVTRRAHSGKLLELVLMEHVHISELTDEDQSKIAEKRADGELKGTNGDGSIGAIDTPQHDTCQVYTHAYLKDDGEYKVYQQVDDITLEGSEMSYKPKELPYVASMWTYIDGEHYGRSYIENLIGDLQSYEKFNQYLVNHGGIAAKTIFLVRPRSALSLKKLEECPNGGFVKGEEGDVIPLRLANSTDMSFVLKMVEILDQRLNKAFLSFTGLQRNAERVTAEEIRRLAQELEEALGGEFSLQATMTQEPILNQAIKRLVDAGKLDNWDKEDIRPTITFGIEALGRTRELNKLLSSLDIVGQIPQMAEVLDWQAVARKIFELMNVDTVGLVYTEQQIQEIRQQQQQQELAQNVAPQVANQVAKGVADNVNQTG